MPGKYRPVSTAEKRAMLEAAGEEWPIGSDGLPMMWSSASVPFGGCWRLRSTSKLKKKAHQERCQRLGLCVACGKPSAENSNRLCQEHRQKHLEANRIHKKRLRSDPKYRQKQTIYIMFYRARKKESNYVQQGLIEQRFTLGDDGQKDGSSRSGVAA